MHPEVARLGIQAAPYQKGTDATNMQDELMPN